MAVFLVFLPSVSFAYTNRQTPNTQIQSTNIYPDQSSWEKFVVATLQKFSTNLPSGKNFTIQSNSFVNDCYAPVGGYCSATTWWLQAVEIWTNHVGSSSGAFLVEAEQEAWYGYAGPLFCRIVPGANESATNIDKAEATSIQQLTLTTYTTDTYSITVLAPSGSVAYSATKTCSYPIWWGIQLGPIYFFTQEEGVIVGYPTYNGGYVAFKPSGSMIFTGTIWMMSNYNDMSSNYTGTQTNETSNLLQSVYSTASFQSGSMYGYTNYVEEST